MSIVTFMTTYAIAVLGAAGALETAPAGFVASVAAACAACALTCAWRVMSREQ